METTSTKATERRPFGVHPGILLTLMREQAGSLEKALAELVMNSVDAGASRIDLLIDQNGFTLVDDGKGFTSMDQLENFFDIFGTPHEDDDAYYGRFRIGRGQIMSYAETTWRSGPFEMHVNINENSSDLGYELTIHDADNPGCRIQGRFNEPYYPFSYQVDDGWGVSYDFRTLVEYVPIPIFVNGKQCNTPPSECKWDMEDDYAWYRFDRTAHHMEVCNRGVYVMYKDASYFGVGGVVVSKKNLTVNLARNAIIEHKCSTWQHISRTIFGRFAMRLEKANRLEQHEAAKLLHDILFTDAQMTYSLIKKVLKIRFIPNIFGEKQSLEQLLESTNYTLYDGKHVMIAERVHKQKRASVVMKEMFYGSGLNPLDDRNIFRAILRLRERLSIDGKVDWIPFSQFVTEMDETFSLVDDTDLDKEERLVLNILRVMNDRWLGYDFGKMKKRSIVAGDSDTMAAWTDGCTYIAIRRDMLKGIRNSGASRLISILLHEYLHDDQSLGEHAHGYAFYENFHSGTMDTNFQFYVETLTRRYVSALCKADIVPSGPTRSYVRQLANMAPKLRSRFQTPENSKN